MKRSFRLHHLPVMGVVAAALLGASALAARPGHDPAPLAKIPDTAMGCDYG